MHLKLLEIQVLAMKRTLSFLRALAASIYAISRSQFFLLRIWLEVLVCRQKIEYALKIAFSHSIDEG